MLDSYANAFFRKELKAEAFWKDLFNGTWTPSSIVDTNAKINLQYIDLNANTIEDFDTDADDTDMTDGKALGILKSPIGGVTLDKYSQHATKGLQIDLSKFPTLEVYTGSGINANSFNYFTFRITKKYKTVTDLSKLEVRLYNGSTVFNKLNTITIPEAYKRGDDEDYSKSAMISIRSKLDDFPGINKSNITKIELSFGTASGVVQVDDFQFSN